MAVRRQDSAGFESHPKAKLLKAVVDNVRHNVPRDPNRPDYRLGLTLGKAYTDWRRVKKNKLPPRYRLFFRFSSAHGAIIYAWLNDEQSLRKEGDKNDVYEVFKAMLRRGEVPNRLEELMRFSDLDK